MNYLLKSLSILLICSNALAAPNFIAKDDVAKEDGYFFTIDDERQLRLINEEFKYQTALSANLADQVNVLLNNSKINEERILNLRNENTQVNDALLDARNSSVWKSLSYFGAGMVTVLLSAYMVKETVK